MAFELEQPATLEFGIYDVAGHRVATLHRGPHAAGTQRFVWDGQDATGRAAPSGVYLVRIADGVSGGMKKVVLAK